MNPLPTMLQKILDKKRIRVEKAKKGFDYGDFVRRAKDTARNHAGGRFHKALENGTGNTIIAELMRTSPSAGNVPENADAGEIARIFENSGAAAMSVVTEQDFFGGSVEDLLAARNLTDLPILRKDFVFDEFQIYETALIAADAIVLIAAMLDDEALGNLHSLACGLGLDVQIETHNLEDLERAKNVGARIISINNQDLETLEVSLDASRYLIKYAPPDALMIADGGLKSRSGLNELRELGFSGFLIGETLIGANDPGEMLESLL